MISQRAEFPIVTLSVKVYRALLVAYPIRFQQEYGSQMVQVFQDCCVRTVRQKGTNGMIKFWMVTLLDLVQSAISEHAHKEIEMKKEMKPEDIQLAGGALIWGAVSFVIGALLLTIGGGAFWGVSVILITFLSMPLFVVGLLAVRNRYGERVGGLGKNILLMGVILGPLMTLVGLFGIGDPGQLRGPRFIVAVMFIIGPAVLHACLTLFGFVALYKKPFPRWNVVPIIAGAWYPILTLAYVIISVRTGVWDGGPGAPGWIEVVSTVLFIMQGIALAAMGYILKSDVPEEAAAPA